MRKETKPESVVESLQSSTKKTTQSRVATKSPPQFTTRSTGLAMVAAGHMGRARLRFDPKTPRAKARL